VLRKDAGVVGLIRFNLFCASQSQLSQATLLLYFTLESLKMSIKTAFVTGVTGTQGGAVAKLLLSEGWTIHTVVRKSDTSKAIELKAQGVKFFLGDFDEVSAIKEAIKGCNAVFIAIPAIFTEPGGDARRAKIIIDAAKEAGVQGFICSTTVGSDAPERFSAFDKNTLVGGLMYGKTTTEQAVRDAGLPSYTILRPGWLMANQLLPKIKMQPSLAEGILTTAMLPTTRLPMVDESQIAAFAVAAMKDPETWNGVETEVASEFLMPEEMIEQLSRAVGKEMKVIFTPEEVVQATKATSPMIMTDLLKREMDRFVDLEKIRKHGQPMPTFRDYLARELENVKATFP
jgi:uncharacterized protein YbjT (DUF2867 family)